MQQATIRMARYVWENATTEQKNELLTSLGWNTCWAETKTLDEMAGRGGGMCARDILKLVAKRYD